MECDLYPTRSLLDALSTVVRAPPLHEAESQYTQSPQVIHTNTLSHVRLNTNVSIQTTWKDGGREGGREKEGGKKSRGSNGGDSGG